MYERALHATVLHYISLKKERDAVRASGFQKWLASRSLG